MIEVQNLTKTFNGRTVLDNISMDFYPGKVNVIIGESGSGKTVLSKCMVGLFPVDSGKILYDGQDFLAMDEKERKVLRQAIGMLFQGGALFDSQTVEQNVMFPLQMFTSMSLEEQRERANFCLQRVNLPNAHKRFPSEISGGMKKRVAIARAMALNPKYLFCDEPNSGLDPRTSLVIDELIREITDEFKTTTIVITHDMNSVVQIGDNIGFIYKGKLLWKGNKKDILHTSVKELNDFVFATRAMQKLRE